MKHKGYVYNRLEAETPEMEYSKLYDHDCRSKLVSCANPS